MIKDREKEGMIRPLIRCCVMMTKSVLITSVNNPSVISVSGREMSSNNGRTKRFKIPSTSPAQKKLSKEAALIAGKIRLDA